MAQAPLQTRQQGLLLHLLMAAMPPEMLRVLQARLRSKGRQRVAFAVAVASSTCAAALLAGWLLQGARFRDIIVHVLRRLGMGRSFEDDPNKFADPTFGAEYKISYNFQHLDASWEDFMGGLGLPPESAIRDHIRQLFSKPKLTEQLEELFEVLAGGDDRLQQSHVQRFSNGIRGTMRVMLQSKRFPFLDATQEDGQWLAERFDEVFPPERPLNRHVFPSLAKLVLLRRVVRTLMESVGLEQLQEGMTQPLVVDIRVELGGAHSPFRLHTVAPKSIPSSCSGASLGSLTESEEEGDSTPVNLTGGRCRRSPGRHSATQSYGH